MPLRLDTVDAQQRCFVHSWTQDGHRFDTIAASQALAMGRSFLETADCGDEYDLYEGMSGVIWALTETGECKLPMPRISRRRDCSFVCGPAGAHFVEAARGDHNHIDHYLAHQPLDHDDSIPDEILYGRAGYLHGLLWLLKLDSLSDFRRVRIQSAAVDVADQIIRRGSGRHPEFELMFEWHDTQYLGFIHGLCGIISVLIGALKSHQLKLIKWQTNSIPSLVAVTRRIIALQFESGNFPTRLGSTTDRTVHVCHGAPGFALMALEWLEFLQLAPTALTPIDCAGFIVEVDSALVKAIDCIWNRGLLLKGIGFCHGWSSVAHILRRASLYYHSQHCEQRAKLYESMASAYMNAISSVILESEKTELAHQLIQRPDVPESLFNGLGAAIVVLYQAIHDSPPRFIAIDI